MKTVAKTFLLDKNNNVLVLYRSHTHPRYAHHPDLPGGEVEEGELHTEAVSREIKEETGLLVAADLITTKHINRVNNELTHIVCEATIDANMPTINLSWEHEDFAWLAPDKLRDIAPPKDADDYYLYAIGHLARRSK